ncbi:hypothetical protein GCM10023322_35550 [Rugosimonospora acidiphila]|uniref:Uncharacterized protein n=1 Tax=Rugosimonospora acidiphila TaxID=556531 RepID=A0ABP9RWK7_9ACTN
MMMNHQNVIDVLAVAQALELPLPPLEVLRSGSASSFALMAFGSAITSSNAQHVSELELIDIDLFDRAVESVREQAGSVVERARAGAQGLPPVGQSNPAGIARVMAGRTGGLHIGQRAPTNPKAAGRCVQ